MVKFDESILFHVANCVVGGNACVSCERGRVYSHITCTYGEISCFVAGSIKLQSCFLLIVLSL